MNIIRLYRHELMQLPEYTATVPTGTFDWKMWRLDRNSGRYGRRGGPLLPEDERWKVAQYVPVEDTTKIGIRCYTVEYLHGPAPLQWGDWQSLGASFWARFEHDIRRGQKARSVHAVELFYGEAPDGDGCAKAYVRVGREDSSFLRFRMFVEDVMRDLQTPRLTPQ